MSDQHSIFTIAILSGSMPYHRRERFLRHACPPIYYHWKGPVHVTAATLQREVLDWPGLVLVEFWSRQCGYCLMYEQVMNDLAAWRAGRMRLVKVEVNEQPELSNRFAVQEG
jgi:thioredoxin-like negative regulator of GroEL